MDNLDKFIDELIAEKGFSNKDPEVVEQIKLDLLDRVEDRINAMIMSVLSPDVLPAFEEKLDSGSDKEIQQFIMDNIPDYKDRIAFELMSFKSMYLS